MEFFVIWILLAGVTAIIAANRGRSAFGWLLLGICFGVFALILVVVLKPIGRAAPMPGLDTPHPDTHVKCPDCAELIRKEARVCKHCGCRLKPQE